MGEVSIPGQEFRHAVCDTDRRDAGIVDTAARDPRMSGHTGEEGQEVLRFGEQEHRWRRDPLLKLAPGVFHRRRSLAPETAVRDNAQELGATMPRDGPRPVALAVASEDVKSLVVNRALVAVSVDEDVRVDGDQADLPAFAPCLRR